ncbi:MAG: hypothetical protein INQ03_21495 [Candidatus Heimdallarchaeota archaeon]|nr:hypothetical protein [Candidatus Heimdallarchaeota archaeon]
MGKVEIKLTDEQRAFIIDVGEFFEQADGVTKISGQIIGLLMISKYPHLQMNHIKDALKVSKSSVSTNLRFLTDVGFVEKFHILGERNDYYKFNADVWSVAIQKKIDSVTSFKDLVHRSIDLIDDTERKSMLKMMSLMYDFYENKLESIKDEWMKRKEQLKQDMQN